MAVRDLDIEMRQRSQPSAVAPRKRDGAAADRIAVLHRAQYIGRVAGTADRDQYIPWFGEIFQLLFKNTVVADIVGVGGDGGKRIGERHDPETRLSSITGAFDEI